MKNYIIFTMADGTDVQLKLTAAATVTLEEKLGGSISQKIEELDKISVASEIIAAALAEGDYQRKALALQIYDEMTDEGKTIADYQYLVMDVLVAAGFMRGETVRLQRRMTELQTVSTEQKLNELIAKSTNATQTH